MKNLRNVTKRMAVCMAAISMVCSAVSCDKDDDQKVTLKFNPTKIEVSEGKTATATVKGGAEPYAAVSSDAKIATAVLVKSTLTVTGVKNGRAVITVTDKNKLSAKIAVTVKDGAASLTVDKKAVEIKVGAESVVTVSGGTAPYTATSKNAAIATVSVNGTKATIRGVKAGSTSIALADKDGKNSATIAVTVK